MFLEGLSIRLALKLEGRSAWAGKRVLIRWIGRIELTEDEVVEKEIEVHIMLGGHA